MKKRVLVDGHPVIYRVAGEGIPLIILEGWGGPSFNLIPLQKEIAQRGYRVYLPALPGLGETSPKFIPLEGWTNWIDEFAEKVGIREQFVLFSHSLSARIAYQYLKERPALASIFLNPVIIPKFWRRVGHFLRFFRLYHLLPKGLRWIGNNDTWRTARDLFSGIEEKDLLVSCLVIAGGLDLFRYLFPYYWRKIKGVRKDFLFWSHCPEGRESQVANLVDEFVRRKLAT